MLPKAIQHPTSSRRALLAGVPALALGAAVAAPAFAVEASPDAALLAACAAFQAIWAEREQVWAMPAATTEDEKRLDAQSEALGDRAYDLADRIIEMQAATEAGKIAKATVASLLAPRDVDGTIPSEGAAYDVLWSLVADMTGKPHVIAVPMAEAAPAPVRPNPDADLLALCAEYTALDKAFCANNRAGAALLATDPASKALREEGCAMVLRLHELEELIAETAPQTRAGLLAKAEAARRSLVSDGDAEDGGELFAEETYLASRVIENLLGRA